MGFQVVRLERSIGINFEGREDINFDISYLCG